MEENEEKGECYFYRYESDPANGAGLTSTAFCGTFL